MNAEMNAAQWRRRVSQTRNYGSCYIPVASRAGLVVGNVRYSYRYYGRSAQGGGHKHKAYAHRVSDGSIVKTRDLTREEFAGAAAGGAA